MTASRYSSRISGCHAEDCLDHGIRIFQLLVVQPALDGLFFRSQPRRGKSSAREREQSVRGSRPPILAIAITTLAMPILPSAHAFAGAVRFFATFLWLEEVRL